MFAAPPQPPTCLQPRATLSTAAAEQHSLEQLNRHCLISAPANSQSEVVFPDNDWDMTEEEQASMDAAEQEHRRSGHVSLSTTTTTRTSETFVAW